ncbi:unnamed protein product [Rotaria magnacalcarata]|uniref:Uncharacterized protein n=1 Tax=Rotaria magnacalcarata TaxID=392030 RepID=A0A816RMW8_9BILA|nr:unnamed protein product [Rotaria magnacalcarata]CAF2077319.1 unnamed protein product [Rotaria magnacalcarata]
MPGRKVRMSSCSSLFIIGTSLTNPTSKTMKVPGTTGTKRHHHHHHHHHSAKTSKTAAAVAAAMANNESS